MTKPIGNPLLLSANVTITPGQVLIPDLGKLVNPNNRAMWIDEIRFSIYSNLIASIDQTAWLGAVVRCQLQVNGFEITRQFIPIWSFGQTFDQRNELNPNSSFAIAVVNSAQFFRWVLPTPLYVPANVAVVPKIQLFNPQAATDITSIVVNVGYAGRELAVAEPFGVPHRVPYVSAFVQDDLSVSAFDVICDEKQLANPFQQRLDIHRFSFRAYAQNGAMEGEITQLCNVRLFDSLFQDVTDKLKIATGVFAIPQRTWNTSGVSLGGRDYYTSEVSLQSAVTAEDVGISLAMIGSREERY